MFNCFGFVYSTECHEVNGVHLNQAKKTFYSSNLKLFLCYKWDDTLKWFCDFMGLFWESFYNLYKSCGIFLDSFFFCSFQNCYKFHNCSKLSGIFSTVSGSFTAIFGTSLPFFEILSKLFYINRNALRFFLDSLEPYSNFSELLIFFGHFLSYL